MSSSEKLLRAAFNRISARLGQKVLDSAAEMAVLAEKVPDRLKKEWESLKEEIIAEANRLETIDDEGINSSDNSDRTNSEMNLQSKVDTLRAKVSLLTERIEDLN